MEDIIHSNIMLLKVCNVPLQKQQVCKTQNTYEYAKCSYLIFGLGNNTRGSWIETTFNFRTRTTKICRDKSDKFNIMILSLYLILWHALLPRFKTTGTVPVRNIIHVLRLISYRNIIAHFLRSCRRLQLCELTYLLTCYLLACTWHAFIDFNLAFSVHRVHHSYYDICKKSLNDVHCVL